MEFEGKVAFVTAAAGAGIGQAVARALSREGATVVMSDQHAERTAAVAADIAKETGREVVGVPLDVRDEQRIDEVIDDVVKRFGRIDVVVNNSGINQLSPLHEMPTDTWRKVLDVSLTGPFMVTRKALTHMMEQQSGAIVNMSSINGWVGTLEGESHYSAAKAGIMGLTRASAVEAAPFGVRVNAVAPGLAWNNFLAKVYPTEYMEGMVARTPLRRAGTPEDIANAVLFLASDRASFITGEVLCVSGGYYIRG
ncbi:SDR family oxidoreductase [Dactylosporangium fulvum]|uniref:SDR family oxidoreductase n=1 Tax=Dactylosporangium fulvum TaxID=53359 RepID=A0ABY5VSG6_9ACTN|nr:SDR family NAD(P)-dependent oxidoreductase [Dactylosporangium fulvum]UWP79754.1 SDR family oxidoreductase [Dactylosporangium fulvum]